MRTLACISLLFCFSLAFAVPSLPSEKELSGEVVGYSIFRAGLRNIYPRDMVLYEVVVSVEGKTPSNIRLLSKKPVPSWFFGKTLRVKAVYVGDEHSGAHWLKEILEVR